MDHEEILPAMALALEGTVHEGGWDQPPMLVVGTEEGKIFQVPVEGVDDLERIEELPPGSIAIGFVSEAWTYPQSLLDEYDTEEGLLELNRRQPPSQHPQRVELRMAVILTPVGLVAVSRTRDEDPRLLDGAHLGGRVVNELSRLLEGAPEDP